MMGIIGMMVVMVMICEGSNGTDGNDKIMGMRRWEYW